MPASREFPGVGRGVVGAGTWWVSANGIQHPSLRAFLLRMGWPRPFELWEMRDRPRGNSHSLQMAARGLSVSTQATPALPRGSESTETRGCPGHTAGSSGAGAWSSCSRLLPALARCQENLSVALGVHSLGHMQRQCQEAAWGCFKLL